MDLATANGRPAWHALERPALEAALHAGEAGLARAEAGARLVRHGPNRLAEAPPPSNLAILVHQFRSPLIYVLLAASAVTVVLGEYLDAAAIGAVLCLNALIGFVQERRAEHAVRALLTLVAPRARVVREGREREVDSAELVPGDLVLLESGGRVPADLRLVAATGLTVDESLLTGESLPVAKHAAPLAPELPLADRANMAYAGTVVGRGRGRGYVVATGAETELGAIARQVRGEEGAATPLQARMARFARAVGVASAGAAALAFAVGVAVGEGAGEMFMVAVALAVAVVPEGLPVAFTLTLAIGVRRMARRHALVRRLPAVETLGSTTVIGSDKTGTLTENRMTVQEVWAAGTTLEIPGAGASGGGALAEHAPLYRTLLAGALTNEAEVYATDDGFATQGDPTEAALLVAAARLGLEPEALRDAYPRFAEIPFESERRYSASVRRRDGAHHVFVKGAPERVLAMCTRMLTDAGPAPLDPAPIQAAAQAMAGRGLRVLAMASRVVPDPAHDAEDVPEPADLTFLGLQGMLDPPRAGVREAIAGCREAGIRVVMITGDHAATARATAQDLGIAGPRDEVLTGAGLAAMDDAALAARVQDVAVYARVEPAHKLRVVHALQRRGEVVAVTGDGVNDAPALKAADIGIAMGRSGSDVAREAADMVLADDDFVSIYAAVEEGRVTFDNLRKVVAFLLATAATIPVILVAIALGWPLPLLPTQILWLNLVTNSLQAMALPFEPGEAGVLQRRPRPRGEGILSRLLWERLALTGAVMAIGTLALFRWELDQTGDLARAQTVALTTLVLFQTFQAGNVRAESRSLFRLSPFANPFLFLATAGALAVHVAAMYLGPTQYLLRVEPVEPAAWPRIVLVAATVLVAAELHKLLRPARQPAARRRERTVPAAA